MAFFQGDVFSQSLGMNTTLHVILPDTQPKEGALPKTVYLLHGLSDNGSCWSRMTSVERYAAKYGFAVVMPCGDRSFYQDMVYGLHYFTYISKELPELVQRYFRVSSKPEDTFVAGLSMGGYGTMRCAFTYPEAYGAAAAFSSVADIRRWRTAKQNHNLMLDELAGMWGTELDVPDEADLFCLSDRAAVLPPLYMACGTKDPLLEVNQNLYQHLHEQGRDVVLESWEGSHEWAFWDTAIQKAFAFFAVGGKLENSK